jgi:MOSC domain-containing protein YiiM
VTPSARIVQISVSPGGVPKRPVPQALQAEGHPITPASIGENLTIEGVDWNAVRPRPYLRLGEGVAAQVTRCTALCVNITPSFREREYALVSRTGHPGDSRVCARVLREGSLTSGDPVRLLTEDEASALLGAR